MKKHEKISLTVLAVFIASLLTYRFYLSSTEDDAKWGVCLPDVKKHCSDFSAYTNISVETSKCLFSKKGALNKQCRNALGVNPARLSKNQKIAKAKRKICPPALIKATKCDKGKKGNGNFWMCLASSPQVNKFPRSCHRQMMRFLTFGPQKCVDGALKKCVVAASKIKNARCVLNNSEASGGICTKWRANMTKLIHKVSKKNM